MVLCILSVYNIQRCKMIVKDSVLFSSKKKDLNKPQYRSAFCQILSTSFLILIIFMPVDLICWMERIEDDVIYNSCKLKFGVDFESKSE